MTRRGRQGDRWEELGAGGQRVGREGRREGGEEEEVGGGKGEEKKKKAERGGEREVTQEAMKYRHSSG